MRRRVSGAVAGALTHCAGKTTHKESERSKKMGKNRKSGSKLAAQIAADEGVDDALTVSAEDVIGIKPDGETVPLAELEPDLNGQEVTVEKGAEVPAPGSENREELFTAAQVAQMVREASEKAAAAAVAEALKNLPQQNVPQIVQVSAGTEQIHFLWMAPVADDNVVQFGDGGMYGNIVGKTGSFYVPKSDLSRILTEQNRRFMERRWLIAVSGLSDEEREALGVDYKHGELLDKKALTKNVVELGDALAEMYPLLCEGHKMIVAQCYADAYREKNPRVTRELTVKLNALSKRKGHEGGDFTSIIEEMNAEDAQ